MFKSLIAIVAATVVASPAIASPNSMDAHADLWLAIQEVGTETFINNAQFCDGDFDGLYMWKNGRTGLVICQDNGTPNGPVVEWTANDLNTLRHEAWHLVQDCELGVKGDDLHTLVVNDDTYRRHLIASAMDILGKEYVMKIVASYTEGGADQETVLAEVEAFLTAEIVPAQTIAGAVREACGV